MVTVSDHHEPSVDEPDLTAFDERIEPTRWSPGAVALGRAMNAIGEIVEGRPPKDQAEVHAEDLDDQPDLDLVFDPDDPTATRIVVEE
jgi:hypothetical protein